MQTKSRSAVENKWKKHIVCWQSSGKSAKAWCEENNVVYVSFITWKNRLYKSSVTSEKTATFIELKKSETECAGIKIQCKNSTLILSKDFDQQTLLRCLRILENV
jgi:hypothetical protein